MDEAQVLSNVRLSHNAVAPDAGVDADVPLVAADVRVLQYRVEKEATLALLIQNEKAQATEGLMLAEIVISELMLS